MTKIKNSLVGLSAFDTIRRKISELKDETEKKSRIKWIILRRELKTERE